METGNVTLGVDFYPFTMLLEFTRNLPYQKRAVAVKSSGVEKIMAGKGQPNYWARFIFEVLGENKSGGAGGETV
jgi:hypothetical protein